MCSCAHASTRSFIIRTKKNLRYTHVINGDIIRSFLGGACPRHDAHGVVLLVRRANHHDLQLLRGFQHRVVFALEVEVARHLR